MLARAGIGLGSFVKEALSVFKDGAASLAYQLQTVGGRRRLVGACRAASLMVTGADQAHGAKFGVGVADVNHWDYGLLVATTTSLEVLSMGYRVFLSYRRDDEPGFAQQLFHHLELALDEGTVFMDVKSIPAGQDWLQSVTNALVGSSVVLAILGPKWTELMVNFQRLKESETVDFVRHELSYAIGAGKPLIPVLVRGGSLPRADQLPEELRPMLLHQWRGLHSDSFKQDSLALAEEIMKVTGPKPRSEPTCPTLDGLFYQQLALVDSMVDSVLKEWREHGRAVSDGHGSLPKGMPRHPELAYRISGEWEGWNDFLGTSAQADPHTFAYHEMQDRIERIAFDRLVSVLGQPPEDVPK